MTHNSVSTQDENGHWTHTLSQSWIGTFLTCPEKARRGATGEVGWVDSDSSVTGSAVHHVIQYVLEGIIQDQVTFDLGDALSEFDDRFDRMLEQREVYVSGGENTWEDRDDENQIVWIKRRKPQTARAFGRRAVHQWYTEVLPALSPWATEVSWGPLRLLHDDTRTVLVKGTVDYLDRHLGACDWKTGSRPYEPWEKDRWNIQRTVYGWALRHRGFTNVEAIDTYQGPLDQFTFWVLGDFDKAPQPVPVTSSDEFDRWFKQQVESMLPLMESGASVWPKNDQHALCSPRWCEAFRTCKGLDIRTPKWAQAVDTAPWT